MKKMLLLLILVLSIRSFSQITFEKGYYISNADQKTECLIKHKDTRSNLTSFDYKLSKDSEEKTLSLNAVKEFGVYDKLKYIRAKVNIDRSSETIGKMSPNKKAIFKEERLFLKVLVEGKACLYAYKEPGLSRCFYKKDDSEINQLVFKSYMPGNDLIHKNNKFKQQLLNDLKCLDISVEQIKKLEYRKTNLLHFFKKYNTCHNSENTTFGKKQKKGFFNLTLRPGIKSASLSIENATLRNRDVDFDNKISFRLGAELEYVLPYNRNKWSLFIEPTYQYYKSQKDYPERFIETAMADYKSIEIPVGIRHY